jgi:hypothetical protein
MVIIEQPDMSNWLYPQTLSPLCLPPNLQTETSSSEDVLPLKLYEKKTDRQTDRLKFREGRIERKRRANVMLTSLSARI